MTIHETIPNIGLGTYMMSPDEAEMMTYEAIKVGYRHIDTAEVYRNEKGVAGGIKKPCDPRQLCSCATVKM